MVLKDNLIELEIVDNIYIITFQNKLTKSVTFDFLQRLENIIDFVIENKISEKKFILLRGKNGYFNMGGDLKMFLEVYEDRDKEKLTKYALYCIDIIDKIRNSYKYNTYIISLINGETRGGGFEAALSSQFIIGVKGNDISLPETKMGFYPGMGAFEHLSKKIGVSSAKKMIISGYNFTTEDLYANNIIDYLIDTDTDKEVHKIIRRIEKDIDKYYSLLTIEDRIYPILKEDLIDSVLLWVDNIFNLKPNHIRIIKRIIYKQDK